MDNNNDRHERDMWLYNHRDQIDPARLEELKKHDADFESRLKALEAQGTKKDLSYTPAALEGNADLIYDDKVAEEVHREKNSSFPWRWVFFLSLVGGIMYLGFIRKYRVEV